MSNTDLDIKKQGFEIKKNLAYLFIPIGIFVAIVIVYQNNSLDYNKKRYLEGHTIEFSGKVIKTMKDGDNYRDNKYIVIAPYRKIQIPSEIFYEISIGDSVYKKKGEDTTYYQLKSGKILLENRNKYPREAYLKLIKDKSP